MIAAYYSKAVDAKDIFDNLKISKSHGYSENLNKYNVINISFNKIPDKRKTYDDYMEALKDLYIIEDLDAWNPNIRSKTSIRSTPTRRFVDTSVACRALGVNPGDLLKDMNSFGLFFEDFAVRDLSVYASVLGGTIKHYRDNAGLECDAVLHLDDGRWGAIEIKLGGDKLIEEGAKTLIALANIIDTSRMKAPAFCMVLTGVGDFAYRRTDGVYVVPIGCLKN